MTRSTRGGADGRRARAKIGLRRADGRRTVETIKPDPPFTVPELSTAALRAHVVHLIPAFEEEGDGGAEVGFEFEDILLREYVGYYLAFAGLQLVRMGSRVRQMGLD